MANSQVTIVKSTASTVKAAADKVAPVETEPRITIILEENENIPPVGQYFGINGVGYMLKAGVPAAVPPGIIDVLENAVMTVTRIDPVSLRPAGTMDRLRFPYRIVTRE